MGSMNSFKGRTDKIRKTRMGFLWILHGPQSPRPHGHGTPVMRPHKVSMRLYKLQRCDLLLCRPTASRKCEIHLHA